MFDGSRKQDDHDFVGISIPRSRVRTEDLTMQVLVDGHYHRRTPDLQFTACGNHRIHSEFDHTRREELTHPLSRDCGCFTRFEIAKADEREAREFEP